MNVNLLQARPDLCDDDFKQVFAAMDVDQSGFIDSSEYIAATITLLDPMDQEEITMRSFRRLDPQGSGFIPRLLPFQMWIVWLEHFMGTLGPKCAICSQSRAQFAL